MGCCASSEDKAKLSFQESRSKLLSGSSLSAKSNGSVSVGCANPLSRSKISEFDERDDIDHEKKTITIKPTAKSKELGIPGIKIQVSRTTSGREIKQQIYEESGIPIQQQALKFAGKEFRDDNLVHECGSMPVQYTTFHLDVRRKDSVDRRDDNFIYRSSGSDGAAYSYHTSPNMQPGYSTDEESIPKSWSLDSMLESGNTDA